MAAFETLAETLMLASKTAVLTSRRRGESTSPVDSSSSGASINSALTAEPRFEPIFITAWPEQEPRTNRQPQL